MQGGYAAARLAAAVRRPAQDALLAPYTQHYLDAVPHLHQGGMIPAMVFTNHPFPPHAIDPAYIETARLTADEATPVVRNTLLERPDTVRRMLHSRTCGS